MRTFLTSLILLFSGVLAVAAHAAPAQPPPLRLQDTRAEPAPQGGTSTVAARIINPSSSTLVVTGITTPLAHQTKLLTYGKDARGFVTITESDTLLIPPGETLLVPNVMELRLIGLNTALQPGNDVPLIFRFGNGTARTLRARISE